MILNPRKPLCWDVSLTTNGLTLNFDTRKEREHVNDTCFKDPVIICLICLVIYCRICQMLVMMCICMCVCVWEMNQESDWGTEQCSVYSWGVSEKKKTAVFGNHSILIVHCWSVRSRCAGRPSHSSSHLVHPSLFFPVCDFCKHFLMFLFWSIPNVGIAGTFVLQTSLCSDVMNTWS